MNKETAIKTAAQWWVNELHRGSVGDTGDKFDNFVKILKRRSGTVNGRNLAILEYELVKRIPEEMEKFFTVHIYSDYGAEGVLAEAAKAAGIDKDAFPVKTWLDIRTNDGEDYTIECQRGFGKPLEKVKACE